MGESGEAPPLYPTNIYRKTIHRAALLIEEKFGRYYSNPHHNISITGVGLNGFRVFRRRYRHALTHVRTEEDIQRIIYLYYAGD